MPTNASIPKRRPRPLPRPWRRPGMIGAGFRGIEMERSTLLVLAAVAAAAAIFVVPSSGAAPAGSDATIAGHVRYTDGSPVASIKVWVGANNVFTYATTSSDGSYASTRSAGTFQVCAGGFDSQTIEQCWDHIDQQVGQGTHFTPLTVAAGETRGDIDFSLSHGASVSGRLVDAFAATPIANRTVAVTVFDGVHTEPGQTTVETDADGNYRVRGIPAGEWYVEVAASGPLVDEIWPDVECSELTCDASTADTIEVADGEDVTGIDFALHPDVVIRGRVTDASTGEGLAGIAVNTYWIFALPFGTEVFTMTTTTTAADGTYALYGYGALESSDTVYFVGTLGSAPHIDVAWPDAAFADIHGVSNGTPLALRHDTEVDGIDIALPQGSALSGTVYDAHTGAPLAQAFVAFLASNGQILATQFSGVDGRYTTPAWYPGTYYIEASSFRGPNACEVWLERPCPNGDFFSVDPTPLVLSAGELRTGIDFALDTDLILQSSFELDE